MWPFSSQNAGGAAHAAPPELPPQSVRRDLAREAPGALVDHRQRMAEIGAWSAMNANLQTHLLAAKAAGLDPQQSVIPWGATHNVTTIHQQAASSGVWVKLVLAALAGSGIGAGTLGLAKFLDTTGVPVPQAQPAQPAVEYEWILDVERSHEFRGELNQSRSLAGRSGDAAPVGGSSSANR